MVPARDEHPVGMKENLVLFPTDSGMQRSVLQTCLKTEATNDFSSVPRNR